MTCASLADKTAWAIRRRANPFAYYDYILNPSASCCNCGNYVFLRN
jgi:hypothetical protein